MEQGAIVFIVCMLVVHGVIFLMSIDAMRRELKTIRRLQADMQRTSIQLAAYLKSACPPLHGVVSPDVCMLGRLREILEDDSMDDATARITAALALWADE